MLFILQIINLIIISNLIPSHPIKWLFGVHNALCMYVCAQNPIHYLQCHVHLGWNYYNAQQYNAKHD